jgi:5-enolpyruvylshikimate-3-phosphate synthase
MKSLRIDRKVARFASARVAGMLAPGAGAKWGPLELDDSGSLALPGEDWVRIQGPPHTGATAMVATQRDHRIAMSAAVLGALHGGVQVDDPGCVAKSWPDFWSSWAKLLGP